MTDAAPSWGRLDREELLARARRPEGGGGSAAPDPLAEDAGPDPVTPPPVITPGVRVVADVTRSGTVRTTYIATRSPPQVTPKGYVPDDSTGGRFSGRQRIARPPSLLQRMGVHSRDDAW